MPPATAIVRLKVNGDLHEVGVQAHFTLLETLRYVIGLTGSKQGCDKGDCRACTVLVDGVPTLSCIMPVWEAEGHEVVTVEGLARGSTPHPLQDEFDLNGAAQCGFCTTQPARRVAPGPGAARLRVRAGRRTHAP